MFQRLKALRDAPALLAGLAALALVVLLQLADLGALERVRLAVFDAYQQAAPRDPAGADTARVAVVDIDEASIERLGQWPWPRTELAELTDRLARAGAAAIAFDIVLSEPDRTSPEEVAALHRRMGTALALGEGFANLPSHDALLAQSFGRAPVVSAYFLDRGGHGGAIEPKAGFTLHGTMPTRAVRSYNGAIETLPVLETAASGNGFVSIEPDADGIVRRAPLVAIHRGVLVPSLGLEAVRVARGDGSPDLTTSDGSGETLEAPGAAVSVRLGDDVIPVNDAGEMWVHFARHTAHATLPAWQIIQGAMPDAELAKAVKGRIVFIGGSAAGLQDLVATPLAERTAGVNVHAAAAGQILSGDFLQRPDWAFGLELALVLLLGISLALLLPRLGAALGALAVVIGVALVIGLSWLAFTRADYLLDPTYPVLALLVVYAVQTVAVFYREERQRAYIHAAFDRYLSPEMVRRIAEDPHSLDLGGEEREMSVLMCDIRGFSRLSERYAPREVIAFLIDFLTPMSKILLDHRATLDKYIGDAVLAFWNAPLDDPDHPQHAARAALAMVAELDELNRTMPARKGVVWPGEVRIGIGLNAGLCCVGNMGSRQRLSYTLIGDTVNMTSRLEGLTKQYGVPIVVGSALAVQLPGFALIEIDRVRVVGRDAPDTIFALLGDEKVEQDPAFRTLVEAQDRMLAELRAQRWDASEAALGQADYAHFGVAALGEHYADWIAALRASPPGPGWDGVYQATSK
jgi:adenylate cyclase